MKAFGGYVLLKPLGAGAMGDVHLARPIDPRLGVPTPIVIKRLHPEMASHEQMVRRFKHEAELAVRIDSPYVAKVYDAGCAGDTLYLAIELIAGWSFAELITRAREQGRHLPIAALLGMMHDIAHGLAALHAAVDPHSGAALAIVHRDLSPRNLMLGEDGTSKIIDLGIGQSNLRDWKTRTGAIIGSPGYFSPEQADGKRVDQQSDIYTLGVVFWELATLMPFIPPGQPLEMMIAAATAEFRPLSNYRPDAPPELDALIARMLERDPARRPTTAEVVAMIDAIPVPRGKPRSAAPIVAGLFGQELEARARERVELLAGAGWSTMVDPTQVVTLARRAPSEAPQVVGVTSVPALDPTRAISMRGASIAPSGPRSSGLVLLAIGLLVGFAAGYGVAQLAPGGGEVTELVLDPPPAPLAEPRPTVRAIERETAAPATEVAEEPPPAKAARAIKERPRKEKPPPEEPAPIAAAPPGPAQPVAAPPADLPSRIRERLTRARALRDRQAEGTPAHAEVVRIINELLAELPRSATPGAAERVEALERALSKLESN